MTIGSIKRVRGRQGIWIPGGDLPPLIDLGYQRVSEDVEGANLMRMIKVQRPELRDLLQRVYHTPMGGKRSVITAKLLKGQGTRASIPDYCLPLARGGHHGLYLELKAGDGAMDPGQRAELEQLARDGYRAVCAWGAHAAYTEMARYVALTP